MKLFPAAERKLGLRLSRQWWEQPTLDILGIRVEHAEAEGERVGLGWGKEREV